MAQLRRDYQRFVKLDTEIIVAGPEKAEAFRELLDKGRFAVYRIARSRT